MSATGKKNYRDSAARREKGGCDGALTRIARINTSAESVHLTAPLAKNFGIDASALIGGGVIT